MRRSLRNFPVNSSIPQLVSRPWLDFKIIVDVHKFPIIKAYYLLFRYFIHIHVILQIIILEFENDVSKNWCCVLFFFFWARVHICTEDAGLVRKLIALPPRFNSIIPGCEPCRCKFPAFPRAIPRFFSLSLSLSRLSFSISLNLSRYDPLLRCPSLFKLRSQSPPRLPRELSELSCHARRRTYIDGYERKRTRVKYGFIITVHIYIYIRRIEWNLNTHAKRRLKSLAVLAQT